MPQGEGTYGSKVGRPKKSGFKMNGWSAFTKPDPAEIARKKVVENVNEKIEYGTTGKKGPKRINPGSVAWRKVRKKIRSKIKSFFTGNE